MKKHLVIVAVLILLLGCLIESCVYERPCDEYVSNAQFEFTNSQTGQSLLFGAGKVYDASFIKVYGLNGGDTTIIPGYAARNPFLDSVFVVDFSAQRFDTAYIKLTATDVDTVALFYGLHKGYSDCIETYTVDSIKYNGANVPLSNKYTFVIQK
jgi:hypothetical protein